jgi:hypothetical protein
LQSPVFLLNLQTPMQGSLAMSALFREGGEASRHAG